VGGGRELERRDALDRAFIERHVVGFEAYMAAARALQRARGGARVRRAGGHPPARRLVPAHSPAAISVGNGLERNQNGGSGIRAIFALPALAGKFGVAGGD
jgi:anaerobic selenocysteine-containing dehydrogenase